MQQYFINKNYEDKIFEINEEDSFHISKVMRKSVGDKIYVAFNDKKRYICEIVSLEKNIKVLPCEKVEYDTELMMDIIVAIPPLKTSGKLEFLIQKITELGVKNIVLFNSERNIAKIKLDKLENKINRFEKIAKEAAEQSKRGIIPNIIYKNSIVDLVEYYKNIDYKVIAYENESYKNNENLKNLFSSDLINKSVIAIFGSEGGLSQKEVDYFNENNYKSISLGRRILRAETAPIYFLSCLGYFLEQN